MMTNDRMQHRIDRQAAPTLRNWDDRTGLHGERINNEAIVDCGWGRLIFAHTFLDNERLAEAICEESPRQRNIALYIKDPHVVLSLRPRNCSWIRRTRIGSGCTTTAVRVSGPKAFAYAASRTRMTRRR